MTDMVDKLLTDKEKINKIKRYDRRKSTRVKAFKSTSVGLKAETINLMNTDFKSVSRKALENLTEALDNKENWATQLYWKSIFNCIFDKSWLNTIDISHIDLSLNSLKDIHRVCAELSVAMLNNNSKQATFNELQELVKTLSSLKFNDTEVSNKLLHMDDEQIKKLVEIMYPPKRI